MIELGVVALVIAALFRAVIGDAPPEHFVAFYLNVANRLMGYETIASPAAPGYPTFS